MEGVTVREVIVCGSEGVPGHQPSIAEEGQGFVVRIAQVLIERNKKS